MLRDPPASVTKPAKGHTRCGDRWVTQSPGNASCSGQPCTCEPVRQPKSWPQTLPKEGNDHVGLFRISLLVMHAILRSGFCKFLQVILRLVPLGVLVAGPPCSSFVWVNKATSKRSRARPLGDSTKSYVRESNTTFAWTFMSYYIFVVGVSREGCRVYRILFWSGKHILSLGSTHAFQC